MKKQTLSLLFNLSALLLLLGCNANNPKTEISNNAHQQVNNTRAFPTAATREVVCHNCRAKFKLTAQLQKTSNGHTYIECPICHHDYTKSTQE